MGLTGVGMCDFDHLTDVDGAFHTACADPYAFLVYRTISGNGVRVLFRVELKDPEAVPDIQKYRGDAPGFAMANEYFSKLLGAEADMKCKNIGRLSVLCHDAKAVLRMDAVPFVVDLDMPVNIKSTSLKRAVRAIEQHLADEGLEYAEGSYNEYVMRTGYYLNALGVAHKKAEEWAIEQFNDYDKEQVRSIINSCYTHTDEFATLSIHALSRKRQSKETNRYASVEDIENFLGSVARFRYNVISRKVEVALNYELRSMNYKDRILNYEFRSMNYKDRILNYELRSMNYDELCKTNNELHELNQLYKTNNSSTCSLVNLSTYRELTDRDVNSLWSAMSKTGVNVKLQHLYSVLCSDFVPRWNPFEDYFYSLPEWDGTTDYIARVASMVTVNFATTNYTNLTNLNLTPIPSPKGEGSCSNSASGLTPYPSPKGEGMGVRPDEGLLVKHTSTLLYSFTPSLLNWMRDESFEMRDSSNSPRPSERGWG